MSPRLTNKHFITSIGDLPEMRGLTAYLAGRRAFRDDAGHGTGGTSGGDDDTGDGGDGSSDEEDDDTEDEDDKDDDAKAKGKAGKDKDDEEEDVVPKWKYDKAHLRMQAADRTAADLRKQLDDLKASADVPAEVKRELEEIKSKVAEKDSAIESLTNTNKGLTIKLAALSMTGDGMPVWEDPDVALRLADLSDVDVSDDGKVDKRALRSALKSLAKEKPYLVKKRKAGDTDDNESGPSGTKMNGGRKGAGQQATREQLAGRFPALGRQ